MNIIISSTNEDGVRFVDYDSTSSYDINKIKLFIKKDLDLIPSILELHYNDPSIEDELENTPAYSLQIIKNEALEKNNYYCYNLQTDFSIAAQSYQAILILDSYKLTFSTPIQMFNGLEDEHTPVIITDRTIGKISTVIVAEDYHSQQIKFIIKERYDGISFLDANKKIYVDYIPVGFIPFQDDLDPTNMIYFLSDEIIEKNLIQLDGENWIELRWNLPAAATKIAGNVRFAISVVNMVKPIYIWQTLPASFVVSANLAKRPSIPVASEEESAILVDTLERIDALEEFTGNLNNIDAINEEDGTITYISRTNAVETQTTYSAFDLAYNASKEEDIAIIGGSIEEEDKS